MPPVGPGVVIDVTGSFAASRDGSCASTAVGMTETINSITPIVAIKQGGDRRDRADMAEARFDLLSGCKRNVARVDPSIGAERSDQLEKRA